jgi:hypothetical protein
MDSVLEVLAPMARKYPWTEADARAWWALHAGGADKPAA